MRRMIFTLAAVVAGATGQASAAPITHLESVSGDLPGAAFPLPVLAFDVGTNTVSGQFGRNRTGRADFDSFAFTIPSGAVLVSGGVTLTDVQGDITNSGWVFFSGSADAFTGTQLEALNVLSPGTASLTPVPLGPGTYNMTQTAFGIEPALFDPHTANYTFQFDVRAEVATAAVSAPAPAGLVLALTGLSALAVVRRRKG